MYLSNFFLLKVACVTLMFRLILLFAIRVIQNCHHFFKHKQRTLGDLCMLLKNVDYDALNFHTGSLKKKHVQNTLLRGREGRGHKKEYSVIMLTNRDDPLDPLCNIIYYSLAKYE